MHRNFPHRAGALVVLFGVFLQGASCAHEGPRAAPLLGFRVLRELPHDVAHYTQGLALHEGRVIESAGHYGHSALYVKELASGRVLRETRIAAEQFAEGTTVFGDRVWLLTWRERVALLFDMALAPRAQFAYAGEGWGLAHDATSLIMSDGSARLAFRDPRDFSLRREVTVRDGAAPVPMLNELEFARGHVFANVWLSDRIAVIDPTSGAVVAWLDLATLRTRFAKPAGWMEDDHVLNGIAWDASRDRFYVTGKCWPKMFELEIDPLP